jgi:thymidylate synthase (FAD)
MEDTVTYLARVSNPSNQTLQEMGLLNNPTGLIKYCLRKKHWSIFEMVTLCVEVNTTRDIAAQLLRHRSFSFQEFSQRYADVGLFVGNDVVDDEWPFSVPEMRYPHEKNRQLSKGSVKSHPVVVEALNKAWEAYRYLVDHEGIATETARRVLPLCTPTRLYVNGNLRSWIHYYLVRSEAGTQKEHRWIAEGVGLILRDLCPVTWEALETVELSKEEKEEMKEQGFKQLELKLEFER